MSFPEIVLLSLALAADAFSVGVAVGLRHRRLSEALRVAGSFGLFQALLPLVGALLGGALLHYVERADHWVAFGLLVLLGGRMIWVGLHDHADRPTGVDLTHGWSLLGLSLAVSIDALAVGITLPATHAPIGFAVSSFGVVACLATLVAMRLAGPITARLGARAEIVAGAVLIVLGLKILNEHTGFLTGG